MKVLFVFKSENFLAPVGLCSISAIAKSLGHEVYLSEVNSENTLKRVTELKPDVVAYSSSTGEAKHYLGINRKVKEIYPDIFTIMGGPHPTFFPDAVYEGDLDAVCIGEGDWAFRDLLNARERGGAIEDIPNIVTAKNRGNFTVRNLCENLDNLPFPDYGLLYDNTQMGKYPLKNFITSRGCPYNCTYCFNARWRKIYRGKGRAVRRHSVDYVVEDIRRVKATWPLSTVKFYDDIFAFRADRWLEEFSMEYRKHINLPFFILTRAELLTEDMVKLLKYAGCRTISMSIEAGNPEIRNKILKRNMTDNEIIRAHRICDKYGIHTFTNCIVGIPGATIADEIKSIDLAIKSRVSWVEFLIFHPYPGTELGDELIRRGLYKPDYDEMHTSYMHHTPLECFTSREKRVFQNLSVLGAVAVVLPKWRNLIVNRLIFLRHNIFFTLVYYVLKMYVIRTKIYLTKTTLVESIKIFLRSLRQEIFRHEKKDIRA